MKRKSRHKRHIELLKKLVSDTDYYVAHVWNGQGNSMHGKVNHLGQQKFYRYGCLGKEWYTREWFTQFLPNPIAGKTYFGLMPQKNPMLGVVLTGWHELKYFVKYEILKKENKSASNARESDSLR